MMNAENRPFLGSAFCVAAVASISSGMNNGTDDIIGVQNDLWAAGLGATERHVAIGRALDRFDGYYIVRSERGSNATLSISQDNVTENLREAGSRVSRHLLKNETDFDQKVKSMISENLWELYG
jgi:hypothetical protein